MKYNIETIQKYENALKYLFFWGHQPSKDGVITKSCLSQWWMSAFTVEEIAYKTAEHWMMAKKALLFKDEAAFEKILKTNSPADAKKAGREVKNYNEQEWVRHRYDIVLEGNYHKFIQNPLLKEFLISTQDEVIVEASPVDSVWGIGMASDHKDILEPGKWKGLNLLGFALMEVRDLLGNIKYSAIAKTLYRPVNNAELELIKESNWKKFPPRLPEQPIFYPVDNEEYAVQITSEWNVPAYGEGHVVAFDLALGFLKKYPLQNVGGSIHNEYWIPAEALEEMNSQIIGEIKLIRSYKE